MTELLLFTCANRKYEVFIPLYAAFGLLHPSGALVEVGVEDEERFRNENAAVLAAIEREAPGRLRIRAVPWADAAGRAYLPHTVRFITPPLTQAEHVYIGDVDVLLLEPAFPATHLAFMARTGLPYANSVRADTIGTGNERTTGLHFTRWDAYYPLPDLAGLKLHGGIDEIALSRIVERKGLPLQTAEWWRPVPGIHASPNRVPVSDDKMQWGIGPWTDHYLRLSCTPAFARIRSALPAASRAILDTIEAHLPAQAPPA